MRPAIVRLWQAFFLCTSFVCGWFGRKTGKTYTLVRLTLVSTASKMMVYSDQKKRTRDVYKGKRMEKNLTIREVSYPRKCEDIVQILEQAEREGRLTETMAEEFLHPFSMQALWACRKYFHSLPEEVYQPQDRGSIALISVRALLASMEGQLGTAREYVSLLGKTPHHISPEDLTAKDYVRLVIYIAGTPFAAGAEPDAVGGQTEYTGRFPRFHRICRENSTAPGGDRGISADAVWEKI